MSVGLHSTDSTYKIRYVGIATHYGLDGPWIESRWGGEIFLTRPNGPWGPQSLWHNGYNVSFLGVRRPGCDVKHPPLSTGEFKDKIRLLSIWAFLAYYKMNVVLLLHKYPVCEELRCLRMAQWCRLRLASSAIWRLVCSHLFHRTET